jgi:uncharacterized damage-inducible protein DinB
MSEQEKKKKADRGGLKLQPELKEKLDSYKSMTDEKRQNYESYHDVISHLVEIFESIREELSLIEPRYREMKPKMFKEDVFKQRKEEEEIRDLERTDEMRKLARGG